MGDCAFIDIINRTREPCVDTIKFRLSFDKRSYYIIDRFKWEYNFDRAKNFLSIVLVKTLSSFSLSPLSPLLQLLLTQSPLITTFSGSNKKRDRWRHLDKRYLQWRSSLYIYIFFLSFFFLFPFSSFLSFLFISFSFIPPNKETKMERDAFLF